jgi:hypothetical protein
MIKEHPITISSIGAVSGWFSVSLVQTAQFAAAFLAALVSLCALILVAPKAIREVRRWFKQ